MVLFLRIFEKPLDNCQQEPAHCLGFAPKQGALVESLRFMWGCPIADDVGASLEGIPDVYRQTRQEAYNDGQLSVQLKLFLACSLAQCLP